MAFATTTDLAALLGRTFTDDEETQAALLLDLSTGAIAAGVDKDDDWAGALDPVPSVLRALCLAVARRVMVNPAGARSQSEQLGAFQHSESFTDGSAELMLTDIETLAARRAVYGTNSGSSRVSTLADHLCRDNLGQVVVLDDITSCEGS